MTYMLHSVFVNEVMLGFLTSLPCFAAANEINIFFSPFFSLFFFTSSSSPYLRVGRDIVGDYRPQCGKHEESTPSTFLAMLSNSFLAKDTSVATTFVGGRLVRPPFPSSLGTSPTRAPFPQFSRSGLFQRPLFSNPSPRRSPTSVVLVTRLEFCSGS